MAGNWRGMQEGEAPGPSLPRCLEPGSLHPVIISESLFQVRTQWPVPAGSLLVDRYRIGGMHRVCCCRDREQECSRGNRLQAPRLVHTGMELRELSIPGAFLFRAILASSLP